MENRRHWSLSLLLLALLAGLCFATGCPEEPAGEPGQAELDRGILSAFGTLPAVAERAGDPIRPEEVEVGRRLYYETALSQNGEISCNSCHLLDEWGVDGKPTSTGHEEQQGSRNAPTVYNAAFHVAQFWDGRSPNVEDQAKGPVMNPVEMAMPSEAHVAEVLGDLGGYAEMLRQAYPAVEDPVNLDYAARAIAAFERGLVTRDRFDAFQEGEESALNAREKRGLRTFVEVNCTMCHNGPLLGGRTFMKLGLARAWQTDDPGRYQVTGNEADKKVFKVPSLRNIERTGPYLHDGSLGSLEETVRLMAAHQLGRDLTDEQVGDIVSFLRALTGELPVDYIARPQGL